MQAIRRRQRLQDAAAICDTDVSQYSLIFASVRKYELDNLIILEEVVARVQISLQQQGRPVVQPPMEGCESVKDPIYLELLKMEFEEVDDTIYREARAVAEAMGLQFHEGPHKKDDRAMEKARLAYQGRYDLLKDLRRASIVCPNIATVCNVVEYVADFSKSGLQVVRIKNRFARNYDANKESAGYRDLQFNVLVPNTKLIWELQVHLKDVEALKSNLRDQSDRSGLSGHQRYVEFRTIRERIKEEELNGNRSSTSHMSAVVSGNNVAVEAPKIEEIEAPRVETVEAPKVEKKLQPQPSDATKSNELVAVEAELVRAKAEQHKDVPYLKALKSLITALTDISQKEADFTAKKTELEVGHLQ
jgi:hypothetical protein